MSASAIRVAAPLAALCFAASMAAAQTGVIDPDRVHPGLAHSAQPTKDLPGDKAHPALSQFSMQDRAEIYRAVAGAQQNPQQNRSAASPHVEVGAPVPDSVQVQPFPELADEPVTGRQGFQLCALERAGAIGRARQQEGRRYHSRIRRSGPQRHTSLRKRRRRRGAFFFRLSRSPERRPAGAARPWPAAA